MDIHIEIRKDLLQLKDKYLNEAITQFQQKNDKQAIAYREAAFIIEDIIKQHFTLKTKYVDPFDPNPLKD